MVRVLKGKLLQVGKSTIFGPIIEILINRKGSLAKIYTNPSTPVPIWVFNNKLEIMEAFQIETLL
jgi:hypothetical protein